jgi:hypothetical protein
MSHADGQRQCPTNAARCQLIFGLPPLRTGLHVSFDMAGMVVP